MTEQELVTMKRLLILEQKVALLERHFDLTGKLADNTAALSKTVKALEDGIEVLLLKNQELTEALAAVREGRALRKEQEQ